MVELEDMTRENEENGHRVDNLGNYARRIHSGLILNGGLVEQDEPDFLQTISYDMLGELNEANLLSQKELGRYEINRRAISWSPCDATSSHSRSNPYRRTNVKKVHTKNILLGRGEGARANAMAYERDRYEMV